MQFCLSAVLCFAFLHFAPSPASAIPALAQSTDLVAKIDELAAQHLAQPGGVGLSVAVAQRGKVLLAKGYGKADLELGVDATERTVFRIASVTKQFTAAAVLRLVEQGKIALDDPISKYVPDFPLQGRTVTIEHLLRHTSGLRSYTDVGEPWAKLWPIELTHAEVLALTKDLPFQFEPGAGWHYNNTGYYLLGMVIEKVSGRSYGEHLRAELFAPLGLTLTRYDSSRDVIENRAQGYGLDDQGRLVNDLILGMSQPGGSGGLLSTAGELVRWQMALTSGKVVSAASFASLRKPTVLPDGSDTGYGFGVRIDEFAGKERIGHGGGIFGFNSRLFWIPSEDLHVAVIGNGEAVSSAELADEIAYAALGGRPAAKDEPIPAELLARLGGDYAFAAIGMEGKVFGREGKLFLQGAGQEAFRLLWQGGSEFRAEFDTEVRLVFADDGRSLVLHQNGRRAQGKRK